MELYVLPRFIFAEHPGHWPFQRFNDAYNAVASVATTRERLLVKSLGTTVCSTVGTYAFGSRYERPKEKQDQLIVYTTRTMFFVPRKLFPAPVKQTTFHCR